MADKRDYFPVEKPWRSKTIVSGISKSGERTMLRAMGFLPDDFAKPFIGVVNSPNDMIPGHSHLKELGQYVKDGVREAGGVPFEFNTIALCDAIAQGHGGMRYI